MKTKRILGLILAVCLVSALVMAEASNKKEAGQKRKGADISASGRQQEGASGVYRVRRGGASMNRQQTYQKMQAKRIAMHKAAIAELEAIKKIAAEEEAPRTVEALQKMIDKKDAEFKQSVERFERQRRERSKRLQQRSGRPDRKKPAGKPAGKPAEKTEEKTEEKTAEEK